MPTMWGDHDLEEAILVWYWCQRQYGRDRSTAALVEDTNLLTGLPNKVSDLAAPSRALVGDQLALTLWAVPSCLAASQLRYHADPASICTQTAGCDGCRQLDQKPKHTWDEDEIRVHAEGTYLYKEAARALAAHGWVDLQPQGYQGEVMPLGEDGLTMAFKLTPDGLREARRRVHGSKWDVPANARGWDQALLRSEWDKVPAWYRQGRRNPVASV